MHKLIIIIIVEANLSIESLFNGKLAVKNMGFGNRFVVTSIPSYVSPGGYEIQYTDTNCK